MRLEETPLKGLFVIQADLYKDNRGHFFECYKESFFKKHNLCTTWMQDNISSSQKGVIRGLHFQKAPHSQAKIVRVLRGLALDVAVDLRPDSKTFGKHLALELSEENNKALYIPEGFAHGFSVLSDHAVFYYKCSAPYAPDAESGIIWNDPDIGIDWKIEATDISRKDKLYPRFSEYKLADLKR